MGDNINKLPWFTHDHNARNDDFIYRVETEFGPFGYAAFFKLLEILHEHGIGDSFKMTQARLCSELRCTRPKLQLYLDYSQTMGKVQFKWTSTEVEVQIKKFRERQANLKSKIISKPLQNHPKTTIYKEREVEGEKETDISRDKPAITNKPYELKTKEQRIICAYKRSLGVPWDDRAWDRANYKIHLVAAKKLLEAFGGNTNPAIDFINEKSYQLKEKKLEYKLATLARMAWDDSETGVYRNANGKPSELSFGELNQQVVPNQTTQA